MTNISGSNEEFSTRGEDDMDGAIDPDAKMLVLLTEREHATILAALRYVARHGGLVKSMEEDIATNGGRWNLMSTGEIYELGDQFNMGTIIARNVCL